MLTAAIVALAAPASIDVAIFGQDNFCSLLPVTEAFLDAGFNVTSFPQVADLDDADLAPFDVVWLPNGIDQSNPGCPDINPIPSKIGEDKLAAFVGGGGGLFLCADRAQPGQDALPLWRDAFITSLGGGDVDGTCDCGLGETIYLDPALPINNEPNVLALVPAATEHTPGFDAIGAGTPLAYAQPDLIGPPIALFWDEGDLSLAPAGRIVTWNNANNLEPFDLWAVNAVTFLAGDACTPDCNADGLLNILDFVCYQALFQSGDPAADVNGDGLLNILDFVAFQSAFQQGC